MREITSQMIKGYLDALVWTGHGEDEEGNEIDYWDEGFDGSNFDRNGEEFAKKSLEAFFSLVDKEESLSDLDDIEDSDLGHNLVLSQGGWTNAFGEKGFNANLDDLADPMNNGRVMPWINNVWEENGTMFVESNSKETKLKENRQVENKNKEYFLGFTIRTWMADTDKEAEELVSYAKEEIKREFNIDLQAMSRWESYWDDEGFNIYQPKAFSYDKVKEIIDSTYESLGDGFWRYENPEIDISVTDAETNQRVEDDEFNNNRMLENTRPNSRKVKEGKEMKLKEAKDTPTLEGFKEYLIEKVKEMTPNRDDNKDCFNRAMDVLEETINNSDDYDFDLMDFNDSNWADEEFNGDYEGLFTLKLDDRTFDEQVDGFVDIYNNELVKWLTEDEGIWELDSYITEFGWNEKGLMQNIMGTQYNCIDNASRSIINDIDELEL